jgi:hypothetical protein
MRVLPVLLAATAAAFAQQDSGVLIHQTFDSDTAGWAAMGQGTVAVAKGALSFTYELKPKTFAVAVLPAPPEIAAMRRLRFRIRSDHDTVLGVLLSEKKPGGGDYTALFWSPANVWQQIELTPADFMANDGANDPVDADGKLDLDALQGVALIDLAQFFVSMPDNPDFPMVIDRPSGTHTFLMNDFQVLSSAAGQSRRPGEIDSFHRDFLEWVTLGGMKLSLSAADNPLGMPALQASYEQNEGRYAVLSRRIGQLDLSKASRLAFDVASVHDATLVVSLEMKGAAGRPGPRYNMTVYAPAAQEVFHVNLNLADFEGPGKPDPGQLKTLLITDITAAGGGATQANTIWLGKVEALQAQ